MQLRVHVPIAEIRELAQRAVKALDEKSEVRREMASTLKPLVEKDFDRKSTGGSGVGGISWAPVTVQTAKHKGTKRIGVDSGEMRESLEVSEGHSQRADVVIAFTSPHAEHFDKKRKLLPDTLPTEWREPVEADVTKWGEKQIQREISK